MCKYKLAECFLESCVLERKVKFTTAIIFRLTAGLYSELWFRRYQWLVTLLYSNKDSRERLRRLRRLLTDFIRF